MTIKIFFPDWDRPKLEKIAVRHAIEVNSCYDRDPDYSKTERLVVNMLRHEFTDYDNEQSASRFIAACTAIAAHYPWLSDECHHQIAKRRKQNPRERPIFRWRKRCATKSIKRTDSAQTHQLRPLAASTSGRLYEAE